MARAAMSMPSMSGVRVPLEEVAVLEGARLALVGVDDEVLGRRRALGDEAPLHAGREARAAQAAEVGFFTSSVMAGAAGAALAARWRRRRPWSGLSEPPGGGRAAMEQPEQ